MMLARTKRILTGITLVLAVVAVYACKPEQDKTANQELKAPIYDVKVVNSYPHDKEAYTQGLIYHEGLLYESTGLRGKSSLRQVDLEKGKVLQIRKLEPEHFGEGLARWDDKLVQLTWHAGKAFVYDRKTFKVKKIFPYRGEGWGLTADIEGFIRTDGTSNLYFHNPQTFRELRRVSVTDGGDSVKKLNELEFIDGHVFANIWQKNKIAKIDPKTGKVTAWFDLSDLVPEEHRGSDQAVLNGIAYDAKRKRLFVTGKLWSKIYEIELGDEK